MLHVLSTQKQINLQWYLRIMSVGVRRPDRFPPARACYKVGGGVKNTGRTVDVGGQTTKWQASITIVVSLRETQKNISSSNIFKQNKPLSRTHTTRTGTPLTCTLAQHTTVNRSRNTPVHPKIIRYSVFYVDTKTRYTGARRPRLLEPASLSTNVDTTGRLSKLPNTGVVRNAWTAMGMNGPNRLRKPNACETYGKQRGNIGRVGE